MCVIKERQQFSQLAHDLANKFDASCTIASSGFGEAESDVSPHTHAHKSAPSPSHTHGLISVVYLVFCAITVLMRFH